MKHLTLPRFWQHYRQLPKKVRNIADKNFELLNSDPYHPSLHFKKVGRTKQLWSVRVGAHHRALGIEKPECIVWFWIGTHAEYNKLLS
jgi:mRNA-degrading endonuclease RelE of RelBE toxin-antitoxin system